MFKKAEVVLIAIGLLFILLGAGFVDEDEVDLKMQWEKEFDKKIEEVAFGETEDGKLYPKIVVFEDELRFYDETFELIKSWPRPRGTQVAVSEGGHYFGLNRVISKPATEKGPSEVEWTLYNDKYEELAAVEYSVGYDGEGGQVFFISNSDGAFVEAEPGDQKVVFYDSKGNMKKRIDLFENDEWDMAKGMECAFSQNDYYFALVGCNDYWEPQDQWQKDIYLIFFNSLGEELWRRLVEKNGWVVSLSLSAKGNFILANGRSLFDRHGELVGTYTATWRHHKFSKDEKYLVLAGENTVCLVGTANGNILWSKEFPYQIDTRARDWRWITHLDMSENGNLIAIITTLYKRRPGGYKVVYPTLILLDNKGEKIFEREMRDQQVEVSVRLTPDGSEAYLGMPRGLAKFSLKQK